MAQGQEWLCPPWGSHHSLGFLSLPSISCLSGLPIPCGFPSPHRVHIPHRSLCPFWGFSLKSQTLPGFPIPPCNPCLSQCSPSLPRLPNPLLWMVPIPPQHLHPSPGPPPSLRVPIPSPKSPPFPGVSIPSQGSPPLSGVPSLVSHTLVSSRSVWLLQGSVCCS